MGSVKADDVDGHDGLQPLCDWGRIRRPMSHTRMISAIDSHQQPGTPEQSMLVHTKQSFEGCCWLDGC
jgi:hypothetical protein